jgi:hypothetical protein
LLNAIHCAVFSPDTTSSAVYATVAVRPKLASAEQSGLGIGGLKMANEKLTDWVDGCESYGVFSPPMDAQTAVNFLQRYLLGEDWYTINLNAEQANTEIVHEILYKYSKKYRKEWKQWQMNSG